MADDVNHKAVCIFCDRTDNEVRFNREHVIPKSVGGNLFLDDAVCVECNSSLGANIDAELLKLPDVLRAFEVLNIPHDRDGILNRHFNITGKAADVELLFGKSRGQAFYFPEQRLRDGSLIAPERDYIESLQRNVKRDKRLPEVGLSDQHIKELLEELSSSYEKAQPGDTIECVELGLTLRKRSDKLSISATPRETADLFPLIAKIAYEIMFFYGGAELFSEENVELRRLLLTSIIQQKIQRGLSVTRVEATIKYFSPVHLIRLAFPDYITILRVAFFGHIEFVLTTKPLSKAYVNNLKNNLGVIDLYALDYQQELDKSTKSFWTVTEKNEINCIAVT
ncbi:MAG: HNH endonuclease [Deltaproteobacteria bacterium]|nr:HNH endonuclease [Deltaproteobacteria bacterium]